MSRAIAFALAFATLASACAAPATPTPTPAPSPTATAAAPAETPTPTPSPAASPSPSPSPASPAFSPLIPEEGRGPEPVLGPGQLALALVEGFAPGAPLTVRLVHEGRTLAEMPGRADAAGSYLVAHLVRLRPSDPGARPAGRLWFEVEDDGGTVRRYPFRIDYDRAVSPSPAACGFRPAAPRRDASLVVWCGGFAGRNAVTVRIRAGEREIGRRTAVFDPSAAGNILDASGTAFLFFRVGPDEPEGEWTFDFEGRSVHLSVR